jgi:hypothetical protein
MPSDKTDAQAYRKFLNSTPKQSVNKAELSRGEEVEKEHTDDPRIARKIAKDHIVESKGSPLSYYDGLDSLEEFQEKLKTVKNPEQYITKYKQLTKEASMISINQSAYMMGYMEKSAAGNNVIDVTATNFRRGTLPAYVEEPAPGRASFSKEELQQIAKEQQASDARAAKLATDARNSEAYMPVSEDLPKDSRVTSAPTGAGTSVTVGTNKGINSTASEGTSAGTKLIRQNGFKAPSNIMKKQTSR